MVRLNPRSLRVLNQDGTPDAVHSVEGVDHVGAFLREARENTGRSVADVAQILRIRRVYLEAIEDGRFDELPGAAYAVGFIRSYATFLRLDVPPLVARFKEEASGIEAQQDLDFPTPVPEGRFPGGMVVTLCLLVAAAGLGGWYWWQSQDTIEIARVPPPPEVLTGSTDTPVEAAVEEEAPAVVETAQVVTPVAAEAPPAEVDTAISTPQPSVVAAEDSPPVPVTVATPAQDAADEIAQLPEAAQPSSEAPSSEAPSTDAPSDVAAVESAAAAPADPEIMTSVAEDLPDAAREPDSVSPEPSVAVAETVSEEPVVEPVEEAVISEPDSEADTTTEDATSVQAAVVPSVSFAPNSDLNVGVALPPETGDGATQTASSGTQGSALPSVPGAPAVSESGSNGRTYGIVNRNARIVVSARDPDTWVQVMDSQQNALLTQMLRPGDRYLVPNRPGLSLQTNNAGGLDILVDGTAVPTIGARGDIRRDVRLDPELLKSGTAVIR